MDLHSGPDALAPVDVSLDDLLHRLLIVGFVDAEHVAGGGGGSQGDQKALLLLAFQSGQVLFPIGVRRSRASAQ